MHRVVGLLAALCLAACNSTPAASESATLTLGGTSGSATSDASAGASSDTGDLCDDSDQCDTDGVCAAEYNLDPDNPPAGMRGPAMCVAECIEAWDLTRWCFDHDGCCGPLRCKEVDGVCEPLDPNTTGETSTTEAPTSGSTSSSSGTDTGGESSTSTASTANTASTASSTGSSTG